MDEAFPWPVEMDLLENKTMKKLLLGTAALIAFAATASGTLAADLASRPYYSKAAPAYVAPLYNWTGFYIGGHIGGAFSETNNFGGLALAPSDNNRFMGGLQGGYDYQFAPSWVAGIEAQYSWLGSSNNGAIFPNGYAYSNDQRGLGSVTGRVGYTWGPTLLYVKGGYAYSDTHETLALAGAPTGFAFNHGHQNGYTVGAGVEYMFAQNWSAKLEYQYYDFGNSTFVAPAALAPFGSFHNDEHTIKAGVNYRFNWGGPVVARY
jgi:outer membrane immunogenic protein